MGPCYNIRPGRKVGDLTVTNVHRFKYTPEVTGEGKTKQYKLAFMEEFQNIPVPRDCGSKKTGKPKQLHPEQLRVPASKYQHLQAQKSVTGKHHAFYDSRGLPVMFKQSNRKKMNILHDSIPTCPWCVGNNSYFEMSTQPPG